MWKTQDELLIALHREGGVPEARWAEFQQALRSPPIRRTLVITYRDATITALQREDMIETAKHHLDVFAVAFESMVTRGVLTALSWFLPALQVFRVTQLEAAIEHVGTTPSHRAWLSAASEDLHREMGLRPHARAGS
jgi:hypothetical protein